VPGFGLAGFVGMDEGKGRIGGEGVGKGEGGG